MNKLIEEELKKVTKADLSKYNPETNIYFIPKKTSIKIEEDNCYLIKVKDTLQYNEALKINWNNGSIPTIKYLKIDVVKVMPKMIKVVSVGYDLDKDINLNYFWNGWLSLQDIEVLKKL